MRLLVLVALTSAITAVSIPIDSSAITQQLEHLASPANLPGRLFLSNSLLQSSGSLTLPFLSNTKQLLTPRLLPPQHRSSIDIQMELARERTNSPPLSPRSAGSENNLEPIVQQHADSTEENQLDDTMAVNRVGVSNGVQDVSDPRQHQSSLILNRGISEIQPVEEDNQPVEQGVDPNGSQSASSRVQLAPKPSPIQFYNQFKVGGYKLSFRPLCIGEFGNYFYTDDPEVVIKEFVLTFQYTLKMVEQEVAILTALGRDRGTLYNRDGILYLPQEMIYGKPLSTDNRIGIEWAANARVKLQQLHDLGYIHGNLREANIMVDDKGQVQLIDFSRAKQVSRKIMGIAMFRATKQAEMKAQEMDRIKFMEDSEWKD